MMVKSKFLLNKKLKIDKLIYFIIIYIYYINEL